MAPRLALLLAVAACGSVQDADPDAAPLPDLAIDAGTDATPLDAPDAPDAVPTVQLTLVRSGTGNGTISSDPAGIGCGATCQATFPLGTTVTLTAEASADSTFSGWGGACAGSLDTCSITLVEDAAVNAGFALVTHTVTVKTSGNGTGSVASVPAGIACPGTCTTTVPRGTQLSFTATPQSPSTFVGWSGGGCAGAAACSVTVTGDVAVEAAFALDYTLVVQKQGTGKGTVTSSPAGINCGADCNETYPANTVVTLTATPTEGTFAGWGGACNGTGTCSVTLDTAKSVTATFNLPVYTLTVTHAGTGTGRTVSSPAGINCIADCSEGYVSGTMVTLTAGASVGSTFTGWSGACAGTADCTVTMSQARSVTATFTKNAPNIAFVTSTTHTGNLGGLSGADNICKARAAAAGLPGTYRAWLSTSTTNALTRLGNARGWVRTDGVPLVDSLSDLTTGKLIYPLRIDESGADVGHVRVTTGTKPDGTVDETSVLCGDWTSATGTGYTKQGAADGLAGMFTSIGGQTCNAAAHLYCFGIDRVAVVDVTPPASYRRAFTTSAAFMPGGGLAAADALCNQEAAAASLPGSYKALLATTTASAASRFSTSGAPWARLDGPTLGAFAAFTFQGTRWNVTPNLSADKTTWFGNTGVWIGASTLLATGTTTTTCNNWTSSSSAARGTGGRVGYTTLADLADDGSPRACNITASKLICLQE